MIFIIIYIYMNLYLCIYTPLYPHFKAFPVSKFNSETSFLYQLFKENSNIIVLKPGKLINEAIFWFSLLFIFIHMVRNSTGRYRPKLTVKNKKFIFFLSSFFLNFYFIYLFMYFFVYTPSNQHFKTFLVSKFN